MLVSTTLLVFIVVGLTEMFVQTQKAFKAGTRQTTVTDSGRSVVDLIAGDLIQMSDAQAQTPNTGLINLWWGWVTNNTTTMPVTGSAVWRTNQEQELFFLIQTNNVWMGVGYAVDSTSLGLGTLYRYCATARSPLTNNALFTSFVSNVNSGNLQTATNWGRVADGVIHLKIRCFDQNGNESAYEYGHDYDAANSFSYPLDTTYAPYYSNTLPSSVQLEVGVLDPDTYTQAKTLAFNATAQANFMTNVAANINVFRLNIPILGTAR